MCNAHRASNPMALFARPCRLDDSTTQISKTANTVLASLHEDDETSGRVCRSIGDGGGQDPPVCVPAPVPLDERSPFFCRVLGRDRGVLGDLRVARGFFDARQIVNPPLAQPHRPLLEWWIWIVEPRHVTIIARRGMRHNSRLSNKRGSARPVPTWLAARPAQSALHAGPTSAHLRLPMNVSGGRGVSVARFSGTEAFLTCRDAGLNGAVGRVLAVPFTGADGELHDIGPSRRRASSPEPGTQRHPVRPH